MNPPQSPAIALIALAVLITLGYGMQVWLKPFKTCRRCAGYGHVPSRSGRGRPRPCRRCKGHGVKLRPARKLATRATRTWHDSRES